MSNCFHSAQLIVANALLAVLAGVVLAGLVRIHNGLYFFPSPRLAETRKLGDVNGQWCVGFWTLPSTDAAALEPLAELLQSPTLLESLEICPPRPTQALMQVPEGTVPGDAYAEVSTLGELMGGHGLAVVRSSSK